MLVVVADVERDPVERPVIRVGLLPCAKNIVLGDVVTCDGVPSHRDQRTHRQIGQRLAPPTGEDHRVERELNEKLAISQRSGFLG